MLGVRAKVGVTVNGVVLGIAGALCLVGFVVIYLLIKGGKGLPIVPMIPGESDPVAEPGTDPPAETPPADTGPSERTQNSPPADTGPSGQHEETGEHEQTNEEESGDGCIVGTTLVRMADGSTKAVSEVCAGDDVLACHFVTHEIAVARVASVATYRAVETVVVRVENGTWIETTPKHCYLVEDAGYVEAGDMRAGHVVPAESGPLTVEQVVRIAVPTVVFKVIMEGEGLHPLLDDDGVPTHKY
jgi:hypothetical protein